MGFLITNILRSGPIRIVLSERGSYANLPASFIKVVSNVYMYVNFEFLPVEDCSSSSMVVILFSSEQLTGVFCGSSETD